MTSRRIALWLAAILISGCASAPAAQPRTPASPTTPAAPATSATPATPSPAALPNDLAWVGSAAEYVASAEQTYRIATARVESASASRAPGTWAVSLDADETVISNFQYQVERGRQGLAYSRESWNAWVRRREATPIPGASAFLSRVRALGGRIAIVTNRLASECADTEAVFRKHALVYDVMLCRPEGASSDKNPRFEAVASGKAFGVAAPLEVIAFVGDNILDFPGLSQGVRDRGAGAFADFGVRFFLLPNPMYGSWQ